MTVKGRETDRQGRGGVMFVYCGWPRITRKGSRRKSQRPNRYNASLHRALYHSHLPQEGTEFSLSAHKVTLVRQRLLTPGLTVTYIYTH